MVKSAGVTIGWNENLHTLGPPWQRLDIPGLNGLYLFFSSFFYTQYAIMSKQKQVFRNVCKIILYLHKYSESFNLVPLGMH